MHSSEELTEAARHDLLYSGQTDDDLLLHPIDWAKTKDIRKPTDGYLGSMARLGNVNDKTVLDIGCGDGWLSVILAKRGARVYGVDISFQGVATARRRAQLNRVADKCHFQVASLYSLPYSSDSVDAVIGQAILHHLDDKDSAARELSRILKPGGRAVFHEPFGESLLLERLRLLIPIRPDSPGDPVQWRNQFKYQDIKELEAFFDVSVKEYQLFSRVDRLIQQPVILDWFRKIDAVLLRHVPPLRRYAREIVIDCRL